MPATALGVTVTVPLPDWSGPVVIDTPQLQATADATYEDDARRQMLVRTRE